MGLRRISHTVELVDTPRRGMILKVRHLVEFGEGW
jgi:ribosomal protein L30/L7E